MARLSTAERSQRRLKVPGGTLGPLLCWAVVFADIGTSVYYTPGILFGRYGHQAAIFVAMTLVVFVLLTLKYAEVCSRYPEGGGVVTVTTRALHPYAGLLGGLLILVDYYLTAALSSLSGIIYVSVVVPQLGLFVLPATVAALAGLGILNLIGIRESARVSAAFALAAFATQLAVVVVIAVHLGIGGIAHTVGLLTKGPRLGPLSIITGYSAAFLAFSGLESVSQIAPAMREPRKRVARRTMLLVVITIAVTSPLLTLWSTTLLSAHTDPNQFISGLGGYGAGHAMAVLVAVAGALLLIFASNTAIIGTYHVFMALARMGFLPRFIEGCNRWRGTPHYAVLLAAGVPILVVLLARGSVSLLGDLYAFGLLGAFTLTALSLDVVRWHERSPRWRLSAWAGYGVGVLTTILVLIAWSTNLVAKPEATIFGGGLTAIGLLVAAITTQVAKGRGRAAVFPLVHRADRPLVAIYGAQRRRPAQVMAILPPDREGDRAVVMAAVKVAAGRPVVFVTRGGQQEQRPTRLLEVQDPYLEDRPAQDTFSLAERLSRKSLPDRRYIYLPGTFPREALGEIWKRIQPRETLFVEGDEGLLPAVAVDRVRRTYEESVPILHQITRWPARVAEGSG